MLMTRFLLFAAYIRWGDSYEQMRALTRALMQWQMGGLKAECHEFTHTWIQPNTKVQKLHLPFLPSGLTAGGRVCCSEAAHSSTHTQSIVRPSNSNDVKRVRVHSKLQKLEVKAKQKPKKREGLLKPHMSGGLLTFEPLRKLPMARSVAKRYLRVLFFSSWSIPSFRSWRGSATSYKSRTNMLTSTFYPKSHGQLPQSHS